MRLLVVLGCLALAGCVSVGPTYSVYDSERIRSSEGVRATVGEDLYLWGSYERPNVDLLGQPLGNADVIGAGVGARYEFRERGPFVFADFGRFWVDLEPTDRIRNEVVVTALVGNHGEIPFRPEETLYELDDGWGFRGGIGIPLSRWAELAIAFRALSLKEGFDALSTPGECIDTGPATCWQERSNLDMSSVELHLLITF